MIVTCNCSIELLGLGLRPRGKMFTREGISPDPEKVAVLQAARLPKSPAEVRSLLFFAGANADFMVTAPLRALMKKDAELR